MHLESWNSCVEQLARKIPEQQFNTWIKPLRVVSEAHGIRLLAPNRFVLDWVNDKYLPLIHQTITSQPSARGCQVTLEIATDAHSGSAQGERSKYSLESENCSSTYSNGLAQRKDVVAVEAYRERSHSQASSHQLDAPKMDSEGPDRLTEAGTANESRQSRLIDGKGDFPSASTHLSETESRDGGVGETSGERTAKIRARLSLKPEFTFSTFVEGKSNQMARAAALQVATNPGSGYNPLFIYGGVGLGKTHLMHAVGNALKQRDPEATILYLHSERFVADMVRALQLNAISDFKRFYRSANALLIDDIQFFAKKDRSQEEFFHTFNSLFDSSQQMIFTCDRYPKEIDGLEERLKSRFGWGLTVAVEPPELETRVAILKTKAAQMGVDLSDDSAFFIASRIRSNVRELEGALKRVTANSEFTGHPITQDLIKETLRDLLSLQARMVTIDNIQKIVAEYYKIKLSDLNSKKRSRSIARPRQIAMALSKRLTNHSLPEIGNAFGGRDHTTVLHACRKVEELEDSDPDVREDVKNLRRILST